MHFVVFSPYYDNQYQAISGINGAVATNVTILHPNNYYTGDCWSSINKYDFWNYGNTDTSNNNNPVKKTIYSPSPTGYAEPKPAAFTGFASSSGFNVSGGFNKGWNFYCQPKFQGNTIFFPSLGLRWYGNGYLERIDKKEGYYWSAGPSDATTA